MFKPDNPLAPPDATFEEPWQAQVLAIADTMVTSGKFTASQWAETLGAALKSADAKGAADTTETYYTAALEALETLTRQETTIDAAALSKRKKDWAAAYLATPHGKPVLLAAAKNKPI
ncbi:MAG: nitrile hydratase accessory protein [Paracoccaceae bacterium]